jgi:hypothetical protein
MPKPDAHVTNRRAFFNMDANDIVFRIYCHLVALELRLKDDDMSMYSHGHDVITMLTSRFSGNARVGALATSVSRSLATVRCTGRSGNPTSMSSKNYAEIRYARREADFALANVSDSNLQIVASNISQLLQEIGGLGVTP